VGASGWHYFVDYQPDLNQALEDLRQRAFADGDYWWAHGGLGHSAAEFENRPTRMEDLFADDRVQEEGTHSILDMYRVVTDGGTPDFCSVQPVSAAEAVELTGTGTLTRDHITAIADLASRRWYGRCAVLHDPAGTPTEIYFWGFSGD
jgi:hypothetical protein